MNKNIDAVNKDDPGYLALLRQEALENTWESKAQAIAELIRSNLDKTGERSGI